MKNEEFVDVFIFRQKNKRNIFFKSSYFQNFITNSNFTTKNNGQKNHKKNEVPKRFCPKAKKGAKTPHSDFAKGEERQPAQKIPSSVSDRKAEKQSTAKRSAGCLSEASSCASDERSFAAGPKLQTAVFLFVTFFFLPPKRKSKSKQTINKIDKTMEKLIIAGKEFEAMKRIELDNKEDDMLKHIIHPHIQLLPNTSGVRTAEEAVFAAQMAREAFGTNWLKLEIHPDPRYLLPDSTETLKATEELVKLGFVVLPYCQADPTLCKRLEEAGAATVMPLAAPIGTNKGLQTRDFLRIIIEQSNVPVVVDAGIGAPSHAAEAMEMGAAACLVNTAIAVAGNPVEMAVAFKEAVIAGRRAYEAGLGIQADNLVASASSPLTSFLNE